MALYKGKSGLVQVGTAAASTKTALHISSWEVSVTNPTTDVVTFAQAMAEKIPGTGSWTAQVEGYADFATASEQQTFINNAASQTLLYFKFALDSTGTGTAAAPVATAVFSGSGYITDYSVSLSADGVAQISMSIGGSGDLGRPTA